MRCMALLMCCLSSAQAAAHAGHDHSHWSADLLHYGFYGSFLLFCIGMIAFMVHMLTGGNRKK